MGADRNADNALPRGGFTATTYPDLQRLYYTQPTIIAWPHPDPGPGELQ